MRTHALAAIAFSILVSCPSQQQQPISARGGLVVDPASEEFSYLTGQWRVAETSEEKGQRLRAIDEATEHLGSFQRGMVRDKLAERTSPPESLKIEIDAPRVTISSGSPGVELELGSPPIKISGNQGKGRLSARMEGERMIVVAQSGDGERRTTYSANGDRLTLQVVMKSEKFVGGLKYVSTYVREASAVHRQDPELSATQQGGIHGEIR